MPKPMRKEKTSDYQCDTCGHPLVDHTNEGTKVICPAVPPSRVKTDEATAPTLGESMAAINASAAALEEKAEKLFAREAPELPSEVVHIKLSDIRPSPRNPRSALGDVSELAASIEKNGVLSPLLVRELAAGEGYEVVAGHRRHAGAKKAQLETVPCIVLDLDETQALELNLTEQIHRKDLTPLEEAEACRALQELSGYSVDQVAGKLGQSPSWVRRRLKLCDLAPEAKKAIRDGKLPASAGVDLALLPTHKMQADALTQMSSHWQVRENDGVLTSASVVQFLQREFARPLKSAAFNTKKEYFGVEAPPCTRCPKNSACGPKGLFDNFDPKLATCSDVKCFNEKTLADWEEKTKDATAAGVEVMAIEQGKQLFYQHNQNDELSYNSPYVKAKVAAEGDPKKRSWNSLVEEIDEKKRPQKFIAQGPSGGAVELYDAKAVRAAVLKHLGYKWAKPKPKYDPNSGYSAAEQERRKNEKAKEKVRDSVVDEVLEHVVATIARDGLTLAELRTIVTASHRGDLADGPTRALGLTDMAPDKIDAWVEKKATKQQLEAFLFANIAGANITQTYGGFDEELLAVAKRYRFDPEKMAEAKLKADKAAAEALFTKGAKK